VEVWGAPETSVWPVESVRGGGEAGDGVMYRRQSRLMKESGRPWCLCVAVGCLATPFSCSLPFAPAAALVSRFEVDVDRI